MAPTDFTGYWTAVITEDWRFRMVTPPRGDVSSIPVNDAGQKAANAWDPQKDVAAGEQCKAFGAGGLMRLPIRLRVSWQDDTTLKFETDNGQQVRLFRFGGAETSRAGRSGRVSRPRRGKRLPKGKASRPREAGAEAVAVERIQRSTQWVVEGRDDADATWIPAAKRCAVFRPVRL